MGAVLEKGTGERDCDEESRGRGRRGVGVDGGFRVMIWVAG